MTQVSRYTHHILFSSVSLAASMTGNVHVIQKTYEHNYLMMTDHHHPPLLLFREVVICRVVDQRSRLKMDAATPPGNATAHLTASPPGLLFLLHLPPPHLGVLPRTTTPMRPLSRFVSPPLTWTDSQMNTSVPSVHVSRTSSEA